VPALTVMLVVGGEHDGAGPPRIGARGAEIRPPKLEVSRRLLADAPSTTLPAMDPQMLPLPRTSAPALIVVAGQYPCCP
jgi:hypothetical protein